VVDEDRGARVKPAGLSAGPDGGRRHRATVWPPNMAADGGARSILWSENLLDGLKSSTAPMRCSQRRHRGDSMA
jgi:hypothetical protein